MLLGRRIIFASVSPQTSGALPAQAVLEKPAATMSHVMLACSTFGRVERLMAVVAWQLETIPMK